MFKRAILQQTRQFSCRALAATPRSSPTLIRPAIRQWQVAPQYNSRLRRAYSAETEANKEGEKNEGEEKAAAESKDSGCEKEKAEIASLTKELEAKKQEAKEFKVTHPLLSTFYDLHENQY
jgi:hypothetical protein